MTKMWMVRAGEGAYKISDFVSNNIVSMGWHEIGSMKDMDSYSKIKKAVTEAFPDEKEGYITMSASQLKKFRMDFNKGDHVITYDPTTRVYHIGKVTSEYLFDNEASEHPHYRNVEWIGSVPRDNLSTSTKNTLGGISTLFEIGDDSKKEILDNLKGRPQKKEEPSFEDKEEMDIIKGDVVNRSHEFIKDMVLSLDWSDMQDLVAGLLRGMGYKTIVSAPGPDRGRDILASPDGLGLKDPRIIVEVKHRSGSMGAPQIRSFLGGLRTNDKGLYVSTGGFTQEAKYEGERSVNSITLIDADELVTLIVQYYDKFDIEARTLVPLTKIYWPA